MVAATRCNESGVRFRILNLGGPCEAFGAARMRSFSGRQLGLVRSILAAQLPPRSTRVIFDCIGPARAQALLPGRLRSPYALFLLGWEVWRELSLDRRRALFGASIRLAISAFTRDRVREFFPGLPGTEVLPLALEKRPPNGEVDGPLLDRVGDGYLLIVGRMSRLERYKGHDELLAAMPRVVAACPHARLVVAGGGDDRDRLARDAAAGEIADRVVFTGFVSEATLGELYRRCAAFVMPSRNEGFGLVYLEAMRAGKPCLALRRSAAEEIIVDGTTGVLVEPGDQEQLVAALVRLLRDAAMACRLGEAGRRRFEERFTFEAFRAGLLPHLDRLLGIEGNDVRH